MFSAAPELDFEQIGLSPYQISGDPTTALIAQLNRFAGETLPGCSKASTHVLNDPLPLGTALDQKGADTAWVILLMRYDCVPIELRSAIKEQWLADAGADTLTWATQNLSEVTTTIAQYGDSLGLSPATVGITTRDPKLLPRLSTTAIILLSALGLGALALGALVATKRVV